MYAVHKKGHPVLMVWSLCMQGQACRGSQLSSYKHRPHVGLEADAILPGGLQPDSGNMLSPDDPIIGKGSVAYPWYEHMWKLRYVRC